MLENKNDAAQDRYVHLPPGGRLRGLGRRAPFKAVLIVEADVTPQWRDEVSAWLVREGCRFMMAWGVQCSEWDDSVMDASLEMSGGGAVAGHEFVMTTWHEDETLHELFEFCATVAAHPAVALDAAIIIHIAAEERRNELVKLMLAAEAG